MDQLRVLLCRVSPGVNYSTYPEWLESLPARFISPEHYRSIAETDEPVERETIPLDSRPMGLKKATEMNQQQIEVATAPSRARSIKAKRVYSNFHLAFNDSSGNRHRSIRIFWNRRSSPRALPHRRLPRMGAAGAPQKPPGSCS